MAIQALDTVVLQHDSPPCRLKRGDLGTVVEAYGPDAFEVEFVSGAGETVALLTLRRNDIRPVDGTDILSTRSLTIA